MKFTIRLLLVFLPFLPATTILFAQDGEKGSPEILRADAEGTHFIVGFMQNEENRSFCAREEGWASAVQQADSDFPAERSLYLYAKQKDGALLTATVLIVR